MNGRVMFRQKSAKQTNVQTQARQQNRQRIESAGRRWLPKQQRGVSAATATTPKTTSIKNVRTEFRFFQFVFTVRNIPNRIYKRVSKFEKETLKIGRRKDR